MTENGKDVIALVGVGTGGTAILSTLLNVPGIEIRYVFDTNPEAPGIQLAKEHNITCRTDGSFEEIKSDPELDLIFEVTGKKEVLSHLRSIKPPTCSVIGAPGTKIIFHLFDAQHRVTEQLETYKGVLESRIIERTEEIERTNTELEQKVLEYEKLNEELLRFNDEKTRYLLQATHHLKAPFAAIQSYTDVILEGYTGNIPKRTSEIVGKIKLRCEVLSAGIKEMLELANLKSCIVENITMQEVSINDALTTVVDNYKVIAGRRKIRFRTAEFEEEYVTKCNRDQLITLFSVIIENAVNYSNDDSQIEIVPTKQKNNRLRISIHDHGIGIPEANLPKICNEYFRSNNAVKKHENGTGLGLAIAREIVYLHNFNLSFDSTLGKGTTVTVTMPVSG